MEPWLDSLSEDWNSEPRSSSPVAVLGEKISSARGEFIKQSQSRIPHLTQNSRSQSGKSSYLRPRSSKGRERSKQYPVLKERSASSLNIPSSPPLNVLQTKTQSIAPSRQSSSAFSDSQQSVQHHTVNKTSGKANNFEWEKRLANPEDKSSDGFDLFSPSKLEGIFKNSSGPAEDLEEQKSIMTSDSKPWNSLNLGGFPTPTTQYHTYGTTRGLRTSMAILQEVSEEDEDDNEVYNASANAVEKNSANKLDEGQSGDLQQQGSTSVQQNVQDPRLRTHSGRQEVENEYISPVTASTQNTIREQALKESNKMDSEHIGRKLQGLKNVSLSEEDLHSNDSNISYTGIGQEIQRLPRETPLGDITSHSLPEDLSVGTEDFLPQSGYIHARRRGPSNDTSFVRRKLSFSANTPEPSCPQQTHSSPPPCREGTEHNLDGSGLSNTWPNSPQETSVIHNNISSPRPASSGSPLKLFGDRDTYTTTKLMRVLTQFEEEAKKNEQNLDKEQLRPLINSDLRMSQFGQGDLDGFDFKRVKQHVIDMQGSQTSEEQVNSIPDEYASSNDGQVYLAKESFSVDATTVVKDRSPKRRRTFLEDELPNSQIEKNREAENLQDNTLAGKKRKDARPGKEVTQASPETLASRAVLLPRHGSGKLSQDFKSAPHSNSSSHRLTEALAAELEVFTKGIAISNQDSRKPSLATKDYMEEANKVMEFIRARGKTKPQLSNLGESEDPSILNPDATLDLEVDESTKDSFSRPPSREGPRKVRPDRRHAHHDSVVANQLRKYQDQEDLDLLNCTSTLGNLQLVDNAAAKEAAEVPIPEPNLDAEGQESSPPGIRILNDAENLRKRKYSTSSAAEPITSHEFSNGLTRQTFASDSSGSSGRKGIIASGTVSIPDHIGTMTFDHGKGVWIRQQMNHHTTEGQTSFVDGKPALQTASEADPFENIPDLSIDEQWEAAVSTEPRSNLDSNPKAEKIINEKKNAAGAVHAPAANIMMSTSQDPHVVQNRPQSQDSAASKYEERLHEGIPSTAPATLGSPTRQARVVTIAFSSPIASDIPYHQPPSVSDAEIDQDDPSLLPVDDDFNVTPSLVRYSASTPSSEHRETFQEHHTIIGSLSRHEQYRAMTLNRRPVSRIEEHDEECDPASLSIIHITKGELTPFPSKNMSLVRHSARKESSILCLTPLSEFTLHQADKVNHPEESYIAERANPKTLRQAHGSHALIEDALVKAITDAEPGQLFWEQLRNLNLKDSRLTTLHGLRDYCSTLERLEVSQNLLSQLNDLPSTLRTLHIAQNSLNDLTAWSHLLNLQYIDVSRNDLESLRGFSNLLHLRQLRANNNRIRDLDGILKLDGLISLDVSGNELTQIDLESSNLCQLRELDLSNNSITEVRHLNLVTQLERLDVSRNLLVKLDVSDGESLKSLHTLHASENEMQTIDLRQYPQLRELNIDSNNVHTIFGLSEARFLEVLSARDQDNANEILNMVLTSPNECSEIYLTCNTIGGAQLQLPQLPHYNLRHLDMAGCGIQTLPPAFGDHFPNLRTLNLNFNALEDLSPLFGTNKLRNLYVARNRVKKMRRTCLTMSRLQALQKLDIRDNPLTVGYYAPCDTKSERLKPYYLPRQSNELDTRWWQRIDEVTWLRRKAMDLLLAECCPALVDLDGMPFNRDDVLQTQKIWQRLTTTGVLKKPFERPTEESVMPDSHQISQQTPHEVLMEERSLACD